MNFDNISIFIIFCQFSQETSVFYSVVSILNIFAETVDDIFPEEMLCCQNREEIANFGLENFPPRCLMFTELQHVFFVEHGQVADFLNKILFRLKLFSDIFHCNPAIFFSFFFGPQAESILVFIQVNNRVIDNMLGILNNFKITNYSSSVQSK